jgi:AcrR family transcriptional regulator
MSLTDTDAARAAVDCEAVPRRQRADAERNRRALIDAAIEVFGERGLEATVSEIAQRAGVGQGTAFRHFATKEHLIAATVSDMLDRITERAVELLDEPDPMVALREMMRAGSVLMTSNHGFKDATANSPVLEDPQVEAGHQRLLEATGQLLSRAQDAGVVRADVTAEDIPLLLCAISATDVPRRDGQPALWERYFEIVFAGLCAEPAGALAATAPTQDELRQLKAVRPARGA